MDNAKSIFFNSFNKFLNTYVSIHFGGECFIRDIVKEYARDVDNAMSLMSKANIKYLFDIWCEIRNESKWLLYKNDILEFIVLSRDNIEAFTIKYNELYNETIFSICQEVINDLIEKKKITNKNSNKPKNDSIIDYNTASIKKDIFILDKNDPMCISTNELGQIIYKHSPEIFNKFISYCKFHQDPLHIKYTDKHLKSLLGIVLTLQTIEYFVRKIEKNFSITFDTEDYNNEYDGISDKLYLDLNNSELRDYYLKRLVHKWAENLYTFYPNRLNITKIDINTFEIDSLPHWRELRFQCGKMELAVCPNGGFINEWKSNDIKLDPLKFSTEDYIMISRTKPIKYDLQLYDFRNV